jgi:hypothetical protein
MSLFGQPGSPRRAVGEKEVKLCALCGALNYHKNTECFTCGWRGVFENEDSTIHMAWQRIYDQYECVEMEHISGSRTYSLGEFGAFGKTVASVSLADRIRAWWRGLISHHGARSADRDRNPRPQAYPPNELGV